MDTGNALPGGHEADWVNPDAAKEFECPICMKAKKSRTFGVCQIDLYISSDCEPVSRLALP